MQKKGAALRARLEDHPSIPAQGPGQAPDRGPGQAGSVPSFTPVPRKFRHDGWTPERQRAFIEALADCGSVTRAGAMVNMAQANCYTLRRAPGAEEFRRAWDAALDFGVARLKDIAFERAIEGEVIPWFVGGKLAGYRRKRNDALLMFCLRHYGQDAGGKRTTINYFSTRAEAGTGVDAHPRRARNGLESPLREEIREGSGSAASASASTTTVRTVINERGDARGGAAREDELAAVMNAFEGVALDAEAEAAIRAALYDCAERRRAVDAAIEEGGHEGRAVALHDKAIDFVRVPDGTLEFGGTLEPGAMFDAEPLPEFEGEPGWRQAGSAVDPMYLPYVDEAQLEPLPDEPGGAA